MKNLILKAGRGNEVWKKLVIALVFIVFLIQALPVNGLMAVCLILLFFASLLGVFYIRSCGVEVLLLLAYSVWMIMSRMINGDYFLSRDTVETLCLCALFVLPAAGILVPDNKRRKFVLVIALAISLVYTFASVIGIYTAVMQQELPGPISSTFVSSANRLSVFGRNPNYIAVCFMISCFMLMYLFVESKRFLKALWVVAFLLNYIAIALTYSRNSMLGFACCFSPLIFLLLKSAFKIRKKLPQAAALLMVLVICVPLVYGGFTVSRQLVNRTSQLIVSGSEDTSIVSTVSTDTQKVEDSLNTDDTENRGMKDTGRLPIWKSVIPVLKDDPGRLLKGCVDVMEASNAYFAQRYFEYGDAEYAKLGQQGAMYYHNAFIQILMTTGIPGLLLALGFIILLVRHMLILFFEQSGRVSPGMKILVMLLASLICYNMFECSIYYNTSVASVSFFVFSGFVIAKSKEIQKQ